MDWWSTLHILQVVLAFGVMLLTAASIIVVWRLRGILNWKRSLSEELKGLDKETEAASEHKEKALKIVLERCHSLWHATSPDLKELADISVYLRSIAACYYPGLENPELRITYRSFSQISP